MVKFSRRTVSLADLWVSTNERFSDFYASSWQRGDSPVPLLVIRIVLAAVALAIFVWSLLEGGSKYWLMFLTNWGVLLLAMTMVCSLMVSVAALYNRSQDPKVLPWYASVYWLLFNITVTIAIIITALYWVLLYDPDAYDLERRMFWLDVSTHGITSCVIMCELLLSRTPVRLLHVHQPLGTGLLYVIFTGIFFAAGGTDALGNPYIYEIMDWRQPQRAGTVVGVSVVGVIAVYLVVWILAFCRDKISLGLIRTRSHDLPTVPNV